MRRTFDPTKHCGATNRQGRPCTNWLGNKTGHLGSGKCANHGGKTPTGAKFAARARARTALEQMGNPVGTGDPFVLLSKAVAYADGHLEATAALVRETAGKAREADAAATRAFDLGAATEMLGLAIRTGARVGKAAVDADVADRRAAIDEREESLLWRFVSALFDRYVPKDRLPEAQTWATELFTELAAEYSGVAGTVH